MRNGKDEQFTSLNILYYSKNFVRSAIHHCIYLFLGSKRNISFIKICDSLQNEYGQFSSLTIKYWLNAIYIHNTHTLFHIRVDQKREEKKMLLKCRHDYNTPRMEQTNVYQ